MTAGHAPWISHADGVTTVDAEYYRPGFASVHVLERDGRAVVVDAGANSSVPLVTRALAALGIEPSAVEWLFLTHVHLDHAGGAGLLLEALPRARVVVHPRGAPHLVDPTRLEAATIAVYGADAFSALYGKLVPIPVERLYTTRDGEQLPFAGGELSIFHTPGHAMHHQVLFDRSAGALFSGDTFGLSYRELDTDRGAFIVPTTTPTQFDPEQLFESVRRIVELGPASVYLTHFGRVTGVAALGSSLREQIERIVDLARLTPPGDGRKGRIRAALREYFVARAEAHGIADPAAKVDAVLGADLELDAQGLVAWLERTEKQARGALREK
ncbi:MAG TPA: MBL fold metallo-hydrolase [Polyangiaceae bacterium]|nr:MBL fold metallo-hydrolase [Polyangiaceae bacterium]